MIETSALMHDMGALILARTYPEQYQKTFEQAAKADVALDEAERQEFGVSHDEVFNVVVKHLRLSDLTLNVVKGMHSDIAVTDANTPTEQHRLIIYLAHHFFYRYDRVGNYMESIPNDMDSLTTLLNLTEDKIDQLYDLCEVMLDVL